MHHKESAEQRLALRRDQCPSPPHQGAHLHGEHQGEAHPAGGEQAVLQTDPRSQEQSQDEAYQGKPSEEAHPVQSTEILPPAGQELPTAQMTTTMITDHRRSIRHRTAHLQQEGEQTFTQPAPPAPRWSKKEKENSRNY